MTKKREVIVGIRPENFEDARFGDDVADALRFTANIDVVESMGSELYAYFDVKGAGEVHSEQLDDCAPTPAWTTPGRRRLARRRAPGPRSEADHGREVELVLDASQIKLFDPDGGRSLTAKAAA